MTRTIIFLVLAWSAVLAPAVACSRSNNINPARISAIDSSRKTPDSSLHTYLALGDSYTIATSIDVSDSYPEQTVKMLKETGISFSNPEIIATNGWTTTNLLSALAEKNPGASYDIVTLLIGVNNQYQGGSLGNYKDQFTQLLKKSIEYAGNRSSHVIIISIPDYSVSPFGKGQNRPGVAQEIDAFNKAAKEISLAKGALYLDVTDYTRSIGANETMYAGDGLHYAAAEYSFWANDLTKLIRNALDK